MSNIKDFISQNGFAPSSSIGLGIAVGGGALLYILAKRPSSFSFVLQKNLKASREKLLQLNVEPESYLKFNRPGYTAVVTRRELPSDPNVLALLAFDLIDKLPGNVVFKTPCIRYYSHFSNPKEANDPKQKVILEDQFTMFGTAPMTVHYDFNFLSPKETEAKVSVSISGPTWLVLLTKVGSPKEINARLARLATHCEEIPEEEK